MAEQKPKKLTIKQKKFVKAYVANDGNGTKAALETYDTEDYNTANQIAIDNLQKPTIQQAIENAMDKHGITIEKATKPIADGLYATRTIGFGEDAQEMIDHSTRLKASSMALKLLGAEKQEGGGGNTFNFIKAENANFNARKYVGDDK